MKPFQPTPSQPEAQIRRAYPRLLDHFGHQNWWPGETPLEVCLGAILTQNTNWTNVEKAITQLKKNRKLSLAALNDTPTEDLARLIRSSGYYNLKAARVKAFVTATMEFGAGNLSRFFQGDKVVVRNRLLAIRGIGPETADSMLLYAGGHLSFVVDAYTKRIFGRHGWGSPDLDYPGLQTLCERALADRDSSDRLDHWQDYHAQMVMTGKHYCRRRTPDCARCPLRDLLPTEGLQAIS